MNRLVPVTLKASAITALSYTWSSHSASENLSGFVDSSNSLPPISTPAPKPVTQPSFDATINLKRSMSKKIIKHTEKLDSMVLISGSAHTELSQSISQLIGVPLLDASLSRFSDGEVSVQFNEGLRERNVFIIQPCAAPVNDSIVELLLTISCAHRSGARRVTAVIPYYGYKHHRRASAISSKHHSRYLTSAAMDFAKMLQEMGVDRVIAVDLQRPGQGHEACFFSNNVPLETIVTTDLLVSHFVNNVPLQHPLVVVAPNAEGVKRARNFQLGFQKAFETEVELAIFESKASGSGPADTSSLELLGDPKIAGADVVIVDDMLDTGITLTNLSKKLKGAGAKNIYYCASHGLFTSTAMEWIDEAPVQKVIVTNTLPLPAGSSSKIEVVSIAEMLSHVIIAEHFRSVKGRLENEEFEMD